MDNDGVSANMVMKDKLNQEGCLFVLFVTLKSPNLQHLNMLLVLLKKFQWIQVYQSGFVLIRPTMLLNIKLEIQLNQNYLKQIGASFWYNWQAFDDDEWNFLEMI